MKLDIPLVSIFMITFNHEKFIAQAIASVLMQETAFPIKLFIGEDCSTDSTRKICLDFQNENPQKIGLLLNETNLGQANNVSQVFRACQNSGAKYIAILEGDDYWTDPFKLQKQIDFLESNQEYGLVFTDADYYDESRGKMLHAYDKMFFRKIPAGDVLSVLLQGKYPYKTCTAVFRTFFLEKSKEISGQYSFKTCDICFWLLIAGKAKVGYLHESTAVYRITGKSATHFDTAEDFLKFHKNVYKAVIFFAKYYGRPISRRKLRHNYKKSILAYCAEGKKYKQLFAYARCFPLAVAAIFRKYVRDAIIMVNEKRWLIKEASNRILGKSKGS
jgi:glycosyltransferase involved in cell wall biosynthesis